LDAGAAGVRGGARRIYDLRHTYATSSLAAGIDIFTLARRMGTSVAMIDRTYGTWRRARMTTSATCWTPSIAPVVERFDTWWTRRPTRRI